MATIWPTSSCFDDAVMYLARALVDDAGWARLHLRLVHGVCLAPADTVAAGRAYAHAWVEQDRRVCIWAGREDDAPDIGYFAASRREFYRELRVQVVTVYTVDELLAKGAAGPWEASYRALCQVGDEIFLPVEAE